MSGPISLAVFRPDCITLEEYRAARGELKRSPLHLDTRSLDERRESRYSNPVYTGVASDWGESCR